jgi:hypothetical protein
MNEPLDPPEDSACEICGEPENCCECKPCDICGRTGDRNCLELHGLEIDFDPIKHDDDYL